MSPRVASVTGYSDRLQLPTSIVVTPCSRSGSTYGSQNTCGSVWQWVSMNPGATTAPAASISVAAVDGEVGADLDDLVGTHAHVGTSGGCAGAVDDVAAPDQDLAVDHAVVLHRSCGDDDRPPVRRSGGLLRDQRTSGSLSSARTTTA